MRVIRCTSIKYFVVLCSDSVCTILYCALQVTSGSQVLNPVILQATKAVTFLDNWPAKHSSRKLASIKIGENFIFGNLNTPCLRHACVKDLVTFEKFVNSPNYISLCVLFVPCCREAKGVVATERSTWDKWRQQWQNLKESNPVSNGKQFYLRRVVFISSNKTIIHHGMCIDDIIF
jgi:hypothetical protein